MKVRRKMPLLSCLILLIALPAFGKNGIWTSAATGVDITFEIFQPRQKSNEPLPVIIYLKNLPNAATGNVPREIAKLRAENYFVIAFDYKRHTVAVSPNLNADVLKLRREVPDLLKDFKINADKMYLLPTGYRLVRDVEFYRQDGRSYQLDVRFPMNRKNVPLVMQVSHDDQIRMRNRQFIKYDDSLLEGLLLRGGYAIATMEHPAMKMPLGELQQHPDFAYKVKSALRTLRANARKFNFDAQKIGVLGFSKGGRVAVLAATTGGIAELEGDGFHKNLSSRVQAAILIAARYDYRNVVEDYRKGLDVQKYANYYGIPSEENQKYAEMSAITYITADDAPTFLFVGEKDSTAPFQTANLAKELERVGVPFVRVEERGLDHRITTDKAAISAMYSFLDAHLK